MLCLSKENLGLGPDARTPTPGEGGVSCPAANPRRERKQWKRRSRTRRLSPHLLISLVVVGVFAAISVGWEIVARQLFAPMSIGTIHALLTIRAAVITAVASLVVYFLMRKQQRRLTDTAGRIAHLLESYATRRSVKERFDNPHLIHCSDVFDCDQTDCAAYGKQNERCWQNVALTRRNGKNKNGHVTIGECQNCIVYRESCPDKLTELGESFNNLSFLLEQESRQVGSMRAQFAEKEKMVAVGQLAAGVAHEVCNPLASISSIVQMLKRSQSPGTNAQDLDQIDAQVWRISEAVRQLSRLARPSTGRWRQTDVGTLIDEAVRLIKLDRRAEHISVSCQRPASIPHTYVLRSELQQVLVNLGLNALDATSPGGHLAIRARRQEAEIIIEVEDDGIGINPSLGRRVFEPFFTTKAPDRGTGLGLAVSYGIVQQHGGSIDFESTPGNGTVFRIVLPILEQAPEA
jgi:signal transduction histidine kinase